jgi:hypothetical protein
VARVFIVATSGCLFCELVHILPNVSFLARCMAFHNRSHASGAGGDQGSLSSAAPEVAQQERPEQKYRKQPHAK